MGQNIIISDLFGNLGCFPLTSKFDEIEVERWVEERRMVMVRS
jgi:hypothetical protein